MKQFHAVRQSGLSAFFLFILVSAGLAPLAASAAPSGRLLELLNESRSSAACKSTLESFSPVLESVSVPKVSSELQLETERFRLQPLLESDIPEISKVLKDPKVAEMSGDYLDDASVASIIHSGTHSLPMARRGMFINFGIWEKGSSGKLIGMTQLAITNPRAAIEKGIAEHSSRWVEVSYHLDPNFWGKGVASEVTTRTVRMAFEKLGAEGIYGQTIGSNDASGKVLKKLGLKLIDSKSSPQAGGEAHQQNYYAMTKAEYLAKIAPPTTIKVGSSKSSRSYTKFMSGPHLEAFELMSEDRQPLFLFGFMDVKSLDELNRIWESLSKLSPGVVAKMRSLSSNPSTPSVITLTANREQMIELLKALPDSDLPAVIEILRKDRDAISKKSQPASSDKPELIQQYLKIKASGATLPSFNFAYDSAFGSFDGVRRGMGNPVGQFYVQRILYDEPTFKRLFDRKYGTIGKAGDFLNPDSNPEAYGKLMEIVGVLRSSEYMDYTADQVVIPYLMSP